MIGEVAILNVAAGDTKLSFDPSNPTEAKRSASIVKDMLRRGFVLLIEVGQDGEGRPLYRRAHDFDENTAEYIIAGSVSDDMKEPRIDQEPAGKTPRTRKAAAARTSRKRRIPASSAKAVSVARTAGG